MHKGVILLVKAIDKKEAKEYIENFLEPYYGSVYDWYAIGGRWDNQLAPKDKIKLFTDWIHEKYREVFKNGMYFIKELENDEDRNKIQSKWEELELKGKNPYYNSFGFGLTEKDGEYNILPLKECIDTVKDWVIDVEKATEDAWNKMMNEKESELLLRKKNPELSNTMIAYYAGVYRELKYRDFSFQCNVFDIEKNKSEEIPEDISDYYAVMVDMHN